MLMTDDAQGLDQVPQDLLNLLSKLNVTSIRGNVWPILLKLWNKKPLTPKENNLEVSATEIAAVLSIANSRPIGPDTPRQLFRRKGLPQWWQEGRREDLHLLRDDKDAITHGTGAARERSYRLGSFVGMRIQERKSKKNQPESEESTEE